MAKKESQQQLEQQLSRLGTMLTETPASVTLQQVVPVDSPAAEAQTAANPDGPTEVPATPVEVGEATHEPSRERGRTKRGEKPSDRLNGRSVGKVGTKKGAKSTSEPEAEKVRTVGVGEEFARDLKIYCAQKGISMRDLTEQVMGDYMKKHPANRRG